MSAADRLPDWGAPVPGGDGGLWLVAGDPSRAFAAPTGLAIVGDDGRPGYALDTFKIEARDALDMFGMLTLRFVGSYRLDARQAALAASGIHLRLAALPINQGFVRFIASDALATSGLDAARPLYSAGAGAKLTLRLTGPGILAFQQIGEAGAAPVSAQAIVTIPGMAVRAPGHAQIDGSPLAMQLDAAGDGLWTRAGLAAAITGRDFGAAVQLDLPDDDPQARARAADALADRLIVHGFDLTPGATPEPDPLWKRRSEAFAGSRLTIDLNDSTIAPRAFRLLSDALLPPTVAAHPLADDTAAVVADSGLQLVTIDANLPADRVGAAAITVDLTVPAAPPARPQSIARSIRLDNRTGAQAVALRLAPGEPLAFRYRTSVMAIVGGGAERLTGPELTNDDAQLTLQPDAFAVDFLRIEATDALLALGTLKLRWSGDRAGGGWQASADLSRARPAVAVARPRGLAGLAVEAALVAADGGATLAMPGLGTGDLWLDRADLAEAGPQSATLHAVFKPHDAPIAIECVGEDGADDSAAITLLRLTPAAPEALFRWLPTSPFRPGFKCRWAANDGEPGAWSPVRAGGTTLAVDRGDAWPGGGDAVGPAPVSDVGPPIGDPDVELLAAGGQRYFFRARAPQLQRGDDGKPQLRVIDAGAGHFLQLTAQWAVTADRIDAISTALAKRDGALPTLSPTGDAVSGTTFLLADGGDLKPVATGTALGMPPQTSLLAATLDDAQAAVLKRAIGGEHGLAVVRYAIDAIDPAGTTAISSQHEEDGSSRTNSVSSDRSWRHAITAEADLADLVAPCPPTAASGG